MAGSRRESVSTADAFVRHPPNLFRTRQLVYRGEKKSVTVGDTIAVMAAHGAVRNRAELARREWLSHVYIGHLLGLLRLHPDIRAAIAALPPGTSRRIISGEKAPARREAVVGPTAHGAGMASQTSEKGLSDGAACGSSEGGES